MKIRKNMGKTPTRLLTKIPHLTNEKEKIAAGWNRHEKGRFINNFGQLYKYFRKQSLDRRHQKPRDQMLKN